MSNCFDVAKYILEQKGEMTAMKLQKLVYYAQAWSLVWDETPLFEQRIEAWVNGPVVTDLYNAHRGKFLLSSSDLTQGFSSNLSVIQKDSIDRVLAYYGDKNPQWLSDLTHLEDPWKNARKNLSSTERACSVITLESMMEYYSSIQNEENEQTYAQN